jgi:hypothetical protein
MPPSALPDVRTLVADRPDAPPVFAFRRCEALLRELLERTSNRGAIRRVLRGRLVQEEEGGLRTFHSIELTLRTFRRENMADRSRVLGDEDPRILTAGDALAVPYRSAHVECAEAFGMTRREG